MKKKWFRVLFTKRLIVAILILLQLFYIVSLILFSSKTYSIVNIILNIASLFAVIYVLAVRDTPEYKMLWVVAILVAPIFGGLTFLLVKGQTNRRKFKKAVKESEESLKEYYKAPLEHNEIKKILSEESEAEVLQNSSLETYLWKKGFVAYDSTESVYFPSGEAKFEAMKVELMKAEKYIFLEYFIIKEGVFWDSIFDILKDKAANGVDVRVMYDDMGCFLMLPTDFQKKLRNANIKCSIFSPFKPFLTSKQNNRDHRKILCIDGKVAFTGGVNLNDDYINASNLDFHWKDTAIMLKGKGAFSFVLIFLSLWKVANKDDKTDIKSLMPIEYWETGCNSKSLAIDAEKLKTSQPIVDIEQMSAKEARMNLGLVQPYASTPLGGSTIGENVYMHMITSARKYLYIFTPYLIMQDSMLHSICLSAKSGVDVRIVTPFHPDKKLVLATTRCSYDELIDAGVKVYEYAPGFIHAKICVCDDTMATVGTVNFDFRSLFLHFECGTVLYNCDTIKDIKSDVINTISKCKEIHKGDYKRTFLNTIPRGILRLLAPMM